MPAMLDDPAAPLKYRRSGDPPYLPPFSPLAEDIVPRQVMLRDRTTAATLIPFSSPSQVPASLLTYLSNQMNQEIANGDTYPMLDPISLADFGPYWFANFGAVMILGDTAHAYELLRSDTTEKQWDKDCLGSFYIKPNYPGRSSHVCNAGFLVCDVSRGRGVGRVMGEVYLDWAPRLGYTYSVFNLVYETNVASCRIWDALGFKRIGRVKGCGNLRSYPDQLIDAIIFGRDLGMEGDDYVTEERFDKIRFYLKHGNYPNGADRAEKSRLRSAATHYRLVGGHGGEPERLMLKDREVISDPQQQYQIAKDVHEQQHGGINKSTATIAEKYHWVRIKETVSLVIRNCPECKDVGKGANRTGSDDALAPDESMNTLVPVNAPSTKSSGGMTHDHAATANRQTATNVSNNSISVDHLNFLRGHPNNHHRNPVLDPQLVQSKSHFTHGVSPSFANQQSYQQDQLSGTALSTGTSNGCGGLPIDQPIPLLAPVASKALINGQSAAKYDGRTLADSFTAQTVEQAMAGLEEGERLPDGVTYDSMDVDGVDRQGSGQ